MDPKPPTDGPLTGIIEAAGRGVMRALCRLLGHDDCGCLSFCIWCGDDLEK